jgi:hypothetical protein
MKSFRQSSVVNDYKEFLQHFSDFTIEIYQYEPSSSSVSVGNVGEEKEEPIAKKPITSVRSQ